MKNKAILALALPALAFTAPALAQSATGSVQVTGTVASKCTAQSPITGTINLGELAKSDGTVDSAFTSNSGGLTRSFSVVCTSANVQIAVSANALNNTSDQTTGGGYTGRVHYTSTLTAQKAGGGAQTATYTTADVLPSASTASLGDRLKNAANNLTLTVSSGATTNAADLLKAGSYESTVSITVNPV